MAVRRDILQSRKARRGYIRGVKLLKREFPGTTTQDLGIDGPAEPVSTYDTFIAWHHRAMMTFTPPQQRDRNAAHRGPVFLPWHRFMLLLFEGHLQRVLGDDDFGLPYWDWAADGERRAARQPSSAIWEDECMGGDGTPVRTGPFAFDADDPDSWRVRLVADLQGRLRRANRGLRRELRVNVGTLPRKSAVAGAVNRSTYDSAPWNTEPSDFRNRLEGWRPLAQAPGLHNRVHVWVGGDMLRSSSPNDPVFYLNHCNVDRIWAAWQARHPGSPYVPGSGAPAELRGHRVNDPMHALLSTPVSPDEVLDVSENYEYDTLDVS